MVLKARIGGVSWLAGRGRNDCGICNAVYPNGTILWIRSNPEQHSGRKAFTIQLRDQDTAPLKVQRFKGSILSYTNSKKLKAFPLLE